MIYKDRKKFLDGDYSTTELNDLLDDYLDLNGPGAITHYREIPLTEEDILHIKDILRSIYYTKAGKHVAGSFVAALLEKSAECIVLADSTCIRALKLFMWFIHNEVSGVRDLTASESSSN